MLKKIIKTSFHKMGFELVRKKGNSEDLTMAGALYRTKARGMDIKAVIDVGASNGNWSELCMNYFPDANYFLIEAQEPHKEKLDLFKQQKPNVDYVLAAAGNKEGKIYFDNSDLFGGLASEKPLGKNCIEVPVITIDNEIEKRKLQGPYLIKLDTHGFEIPILEGAKHTLKNAGLVIIEAYNYKLTADSLRFFELCKYMEDLGFSTIEMVDFMLRKKDASFWQMDMFFIPSSRKEFFYNEYI